MKQILFFLIGLFLLNNSQAQYVIDLDFESHELGAVTVDGASRENCAGWSQCNDGVCPPIPLMVSDIQAREGNKSLRFEFDKNNWILHGDGYCALRNEIRWDSDIRLGEEAWIGFSVFPTLGEDGSVKYNSDGDSWICQLKNECGPGNRGGIQIRGDVFRISRDGMELGPVKYNEWNDIVLHYKYHETNGFINYYVNGNMYSRNYNTSSNSCKIDFKIGLYGWHPQGKTVIYFDEIKVLIGEGNSYEDVVPGYECLEEQVPAAPTGLSGNATASRQITLEWTDNSDNEKGFIIKRKLQGGSFSVISKPIRNITQYVDNQVDDGNTYIYRIAAYNCYGDSPFDQEISVLLEKDHSQLLPVKSVSASKHLGNYVPANTIDQKFNTYWLIEGENEWLQLEFSEIAKIQRIHLAFIHGDQREYDFSIETSMDGTQWTSQGSFTSSGSATGFEEFNLPDNPEGKYIRYITGLNSVDDRTWLAEIEARGIITTSAENIIVQDDIQIRQSPNGKSLEITFNENAFSNATLYAYNIAGQLARSEKSTHSPHYFNTSGFIPGIYLIKLQGLQNVAIRKVLIK